MSGSDNRAPSHSALTPRRRDQLLATYRDGLLHDTLPFWIDHAVDREHGGFTVALDRDGTVLDTDKGMWQQCRFTWLLASLHQQFPQNGEWLNLARHGIEFISKHGFDRDGRMFFWVTRDGRPLRKRRYVFTECFAVIAYASYGKAAGDELASQKARDLFDLIVRYQSTPGLLEPKVDPAVRSMKGLGGPMIRIVTAQILRESLDDLTFTRWIDESITEIERDFMKPELETVLETVGPAGEFLDHFDGRMLNPGHAIEAAWFILQESKVRGNDPRLLKLGLTILDWMWKRGWDEEYGGIIYYRDVLGLPVQEYWHDMKFWWPQNEVIIATLLAYQLTGAPKYLQWHEQAHDWAYRHFPDPEYGEWFGYLHRDGRVSTALKGNLWKGPFHLPRMQWVCWNLLEEMKTVAP